MCESVCLWVCFCVGVGGVCVLVPVCVGARELFNYPVFYPSIDSCCVLMDMEHFNNGWMTIKGINDSGILPDPPTTARIHPGSILVLMSFTTVGEC